MRAVLLLLGLGLSPVARAACDAPYDSGQLLEDLVMVEEALRQGDGPTAGAVATKMETGLGCLAEPLPYMIVSRVYRGVAAGKFLGGDEARGKEWFLTAMELDPTFEYGLEDIPADSPIRVAYRGLREEAETAPVQLEGRELVEGRHFLDGSLLGGPRATPNRPHVYQTDATGTFQSWVIQGNAFPDVALAAPVVAEAEPAAEEEEPRKKKKKKRDEPEPVEAEEPAVAEADEPAREKKKKKAEEAPVDTSGYYARVRPPEKTPLMIGGSAILVGAGGLYALSMVARGQFDDATTEEDIRKYQKRTNDLVLISAGTAAAGAAALGWGIIVDATGRPLPGIHIRF